MFREVFGRNILGIDIAEPLGETRFRADVFAKQLPGLSILWARYSPLRGARTRAQLADGNDGMAFPWSASPSVGEHTGRNLELGSNDGVLISCSDPGGSAFPTAAPMVSLAFPRKALGPLLRDGEDSAGRPVPADRPAFTLLRRYIDVLKGEDTTVTPELQKLAVTHVYDLLALAVGPTHDAQDTAARRGAGAAHLSAIEKEITESLGADISIERLAARHKLSARHVQRLFEGSGTTFTEFVRAVRLERARDMLLSPRFQRKPISDIAFEAGFRDLSHCNRWFRARYGASPSELRSHA